MNNWTPPALELKAKKNIKAASALRAILYAEQYWPSEILEKPYVYLDTTTAPLLFLTDPYLVKEALNRNDGTLPRSRLQQRFAGHGTGKENVIVDSGVRSQAHRRSLSPLFRPKSIADYFPFIRATIEQALLPLSDAEKNQQTCDIGRVCVQATFGVIWQIMFGTANKLTPPEVVTQLADVLYEAGLSGNLKSTAKTVLHAKNISMKLQPTQPIATTTPFGKKPPEDLVLTAQEIADNAQFLLTAGHESTALTITWAFYILANNPEEQEIIASEILKATNGQDISKESLNLMPCLSNLLNETMRLYPAAIVISREAAKNIQLGDLDITQGTQIAISFYGMHRHIAHWDAPNEFRPERFGTKDKPNKYSAFLPFSGGHHSCLGAHLAWTEAMYTLASVLQKYRITTTNEIKPIARYTLRPNDELLINLHKR